MQINGSTNVYGLGNLLPGISSPSAQSGTGTQFDPQLAVLGDAFGRAKDLGDSLTELDQLISTARATRTRRALAVSVQTLGLGEAALTATTLRSNEQVNATPNSFSPFGPEYTGLGLSTAAPTLTGVYDGSNGTGALTFESRRDGTHGEDRLRFRVRDPGGSIIDDIRIRRGDPIDQEYTLSNGIVLSLGEGSVVRRDSFSIDVFAGVGSVVDPDKAFNGTRNANPNLQYGFSVTDGSFEINGVAIEVNASDSINAVLGRINASSAGVTAVFDVATEQVALTQNSPGSGFNISLASDTSGFLQATKLDSAVAIPGTDGDSGTPISDLRRFAAVSSGAIKVNGVSIALDVNVDSLGDILSRINASETHIHASLINDRVFLESNYRKDTMLLEDGGTGLFDALSIRAGRYKPIARDGVALDTAREIASSVAQTTSALKRLLDGNDAPAEVARLHARVQGLLSAAEAGLVEGSQPRFGLILETDSQAASLVPELNINELVSSLRINFSDFRAAFIGEDPDARNGFVRQLLDVVNQFTADLRGRTDSGTFLVGLTA